MRVEDAQQSAQIFGYVTIDIEKIAEAYTEVLERAELIRCVAAGEPASIICTRQRRRRMVNP